MRRVGSVRVCWVVLERLFSTEHLIRRPLSPVPSDGLCYLWGILGKGDILLQEIGIEELNNAFKVTSVKGGALLCPGSCDFTARAVYKPRSLPASPLLSRPSPTHREGAWPTQPCTILHLSRTGKPGGLYISEAVRS